MAILRSRDSWRKRTIRPLRASSRAASEPFTTSTSGRSPSTRISSPSAITSGGPVNQSSGTRDANQAASCSGLIDYIITCPLASLTSGGLRSQYVDSRRGRFLVLGAEQLEALDYDLRRVPLAPLGVLPAPRLQTPVRV